MLSTRSAARGPARDDVLRQVRVLVLRSAAAEAQVPDLQAPAHVHEDVRPARHRRHGAQVEDVLYAHHALRVDGAVQTPEHAQEVAQAREQLVTELGYERFCGALFMLLESRKHTNTKTVNQIISRCA